jgi:hypothetical protein
MNFDLFSQALPGRDNTMTAPTGDGMLGGVGRLARYQAFLNPRPSMRQRS